MATRFGNANSSSLLRTVQAAQDRKTALEDQIQAFTFSTSDRGSSDFGAYKDYLGKRISTTNDPSKQLSLKKTLLDANRSFTSSEITKAGIDVLGGTGTNEDKLNRVVQLFHAAQSNGDDYLAQSLQSQGMQLEKTINDANVAAQNAQISANNKAASASLKANKEYLTSLKNQAQDLIDAPLVNGHLPTGADGQEMTSLKALQESYQKGGKEFLARLQANGTSYLQTAKSIIDAASAYYKEAAAKAMDPEDARSYGKLYQDIQTGKTKFITYNDANGKPVELNYQDLSNRIDVERRKDATLTPGQDISGQGAFIDRPINGQKFYTDENGKIRLGASYVGSNIFSAQQVKSTVSQFNKLGYAATYDSTNGVFKVTSPTGRAEFTGTIGPDGNFIFNTGKQDAQGNDIVNRITLNGQDAGLNARITNDEINGIMQNNGGLLTAPADQNLPDKVGKSVNAARPAVGVAAAALGLGPQYQAIDSLVSMGDKKRADAAKAAEQQRRLDEATAAAKTRDEAARASLAALHPNAVVNPVTGKVGGAGVPSVYKVPEAYTQAQQTVGTQAFNQQMLPVLGNAPAITSSPAPSQPSVLGQIGNAVKGAIGGIFGGFHF